MTKRLFLAFVFCPSASPGLADGAAEANRLMIEAVRLIQASELEPPAAGKFPLPAKAHPSRS